MRFLIVALVAVGIIASSGVARADKRVAFVVGNGTYRNVATLPNPPVDAAAMAATLRNVGFDVVEGVNLTRDGMTEKLLDFGQRAQGSDVALFYYAGHGIAINGVNYLLPVDADIKSEMDVKLGAAINVDLTLDQTMADAKVKLVFLDACRDNPFAARIRSASTRSVNVQAGLAEMKSGEGTLIAFATGPGQTALDGDTGKNSPFTRALIAHIALPGVEIQQAMTEVRAQVSEETKKRQLPWGHTNLIGSVYLNPAELPPPNAVAAVPAGPALAAAPRSGSSDVELEFWRSVKDSNKPEELNALRVLLNSGKRLTAVEAAILGETCDLDQHGILDLDRLVESPYVGKCPPDRAGFEIVEPVTVRGEPAMLATMIRNLFDNALRHTPRGGRIDVGVYREDGSAVVQIEDSGPGIAAADLEKIFEPFFRGSRPQGEGAGLGLSIVKRIVESLGGGITLENIANHGQSGVRATVRLPVRDT